MRRRAFLQAGVALALSSRRLRASPPSSRVVVVGAGYGGATCAGELRRRLPEAELILVEARERFFTGPFSNLVVAGLREPASIEHRSRDVAAALNLRLVLSEVLELDPVRRCLRCADGTQLQADLIVISPGIAMRWNAVEGLDEQASRTMPHAWCGDAQLLDLRQRVAALADGALVVVSAPPHPYRCPPGPYERAGLIADALRRRRLKRWKILIADAKDDFSKRPLFQQHWDWEFGERIEWVPRYLGGELRRVDAHEGSVWLSGERGALQPQLASLVPPQQAATLAQRSDLCDASGWCPVAAENFESLRHPGIYVIGDSALAAPLPKSAFAANSQAKLCAAVIAARLRSVPAPEPQFLNTCYSFLDADQAISISGLYGVQARRFVTLSEGTSELSADGAERRYEGRAAQAWYRSLDADSFGPRP
jgi:sulfide dehydrogenase [flavocytochrome c] flavoprotein subunit